VAVVVPHGVLFRGGAEGRIRRALIEENLLDAVIGLPGNLFPTTSIPVAILVFDRSREKGGAREACRTCCSSTPAASSRRQDQNALLDSTWQDSRHLPRPPAGRQVRHVASLQEIAENDFNLNIPRYVDTFEEEEEIDVAAVSRRSSAWRASWPRCARMKQYLKELGV
jgi:type I restriction enzyme M protein